MGEVIGFPGGKFSAAKFGQSVEGLVDRLRTRIELDCTEFPVDETARQERRRRAMDPETGFAFLRATYFPHYHDMPDNELHRDLEVELPRMVRDPKGRKGAIVAPRGSAKTTICSLEFPIWLVLLRLKRFLIVCSDTSDQAELMLTAIKLEIEENSRLHYDFPELVPGSKWTADEIRINKCAIFARGRGQKLRSLRYGPFRPDYVSLDDIENDENVESPAQRDKGENWIDSAVLKLGRADNTLDVVLVGTILHFDSILARKANKPGWRVRRFEAIMDWPSDMDRWSQFAELIQNSNDDEFVEALAFYEANRAVMDEGARVMWPEMQPLVQLMTEWAEDPDAFMRERQNEPIAKNALFREFTFSVQVRREWITFGAIDPSLGKSAKGRDPSAILVGALSPGDNILHVIEASIRKRLPDTIIDHTISMQIEHRCQLWFVEAVQFQEFLRTEIMHKAARVGVALPTVPIVPIADKQLRIERLQPPVASGLIRFAAHQKVLLDQLRQFPNGAHDDGPDCLEMLWDNALRHASGSISGALQLSAGLGPSGSAMRGYRLGR